MSNSSEVDTFAAVASIVLIATDTTATLTATHSFNFEIGFLTMSEPMLSMVELWHIR